MAARIVHHAAAERLLKCVEFKNPDRFRLGIIMPDSAGWSSEESKKAHFLKLICGGTKKDLRFNSIPQQIRTEGDDR